MIDDHKNTKKDYKSGLPVLFNNTIKGKYRIKFDESFLKMILNFLFKDKTVLRTRKALKSIKLLFESIDDTVYNEKFTSQNLIWLIRKSVDAWLSPDCNSKTFVELLIKDDIDFDDSKEKLLNEIDPDAISYEECRTLINQIDDRLRFGYVGSEMESFRNIVNKIDIDDYKSFRAVDNDLYQYAVSVVNAKRNTNSLDSDQTFSLQDGIMDTVVSDSLTRLKDRNKVFITGIRRLNTILGGAFLSKKLYVFLALPAGGKSQMLLKVALDIKKYNPMIKPKNPEKRPVILLLTMENDIDETIERMFNMSGSDGDIRNFTIAQVIKKMRTEGHLTLNTDNDIDIIIKYYPNRSIDTNDLYSIINDLSDAGEEVEVLIVDYAKRLRAAERGKDEKEELKNITNELKTLAKVEDICVITAQQLNRSAASTVDAAIRDHKGDTTRLIGRENVGSAWEIIENADWTCILNPERKPDTDEAFMTFKLVKRRYRSFEEDEDLRRLTYFSHPYETKETIRLIDDIYLDKPVSVYSLVSDFDPTQSRLPKHKKDGEDNQINKYAKPDSVNDIFGRFDPNNEGNQF